MRTVLGIAAVLFLIATFAWVGGIETEQLDLVTGAVLLLLSVIGFGVCAMAAQSYTGGTRK